jgi:hypothetical protein
VNPTAQWRNGKFPTGFRYIVTANIYFYRVVEGRPRMALFAGEVGIEAGDELTYDYNFT